MTRPFSEWDVRQVCGRTSFDRGHAYWKARRVLAVRWDAENECVLAQVAGSGANCYEVDIQLLPEELTYRFDGECSCPVGVNCKHVAAVMLEWLQSYRQQGQATPAAPPRAQDDLALWQQRVAALTRSPSPSAEAGSGAGRLSLLFILSSQAYLDNTRIDLVACKSKQLKTGHWGKATPYNLSQLGGYYYPPNWVKPVDIEIAELAKKSVTGGTLCIAGDIGPVLLSRLLRTGRCFWQSEQKPPLEPGPARRASFRWQEDSRGQSCLTIALEGLDGPWVPVPSDPPWYIDPKGNTCGAVQQPLAADFFHALCHLPPVPAKKLATLNLFLASRVPASDFPLPGALEFKTWEEPPVPVLNLLGRTHPRGHVSHVARLEFDYGPVRMSSESGGMRQMEQQEVFSVNGEDWLIRRDGVYEQQCLRQLMAYGFSPAQVAGLGEPGRCDLVFASSDLSASALMWRSFLEELDTLAAQGWRIEKGDDFLLRFDTVESLDANLEDSEKGWFDIGLDIQYGELRIPMIPLVLQWLQQGMPDQPLLFFVGEGVWLEVPKQLLEPVVRTLVELHQRPDLDSQGRMRLVQQQAPSLLALQERTAESGIALRWQGGEQIRRMGEKLRNFEGIASVAAPEGLQAQLRPYQQQGLSWLQFLREYGFGGILADDMGLGKTLQALAHLLIEKEAGRLEKPALVVAPTSVLGNWRREAERFAPALRVLVLHGGGRAEHFETLGDYDLVITSYALLLRDAEVLCNLAFHSVILDEAQYIKNAKAKVAQAACALNTANRLCLTGTPLENHLGELWSLFHFLMPGFLGNEGAFNTLFRYPIEKRGQSDRRAELARRIGPFVLRRDKKQVASELPPKTEIVQTVELPDAQRRLYESIRAAMAAKVSALLQEKGLARSHIEMLDALLKLRQVCCDPRLLKMESAKKVPHSAKLELLREMLVELMEEGRKVILFSQFTSMLSLIEAELKTLGIAYAKLTGQTRKREEVIASFQGGDVPLFLVSLKAGGTGLNLTAADTVIHYDPWWNPAVERQATDRAYRIGQDKPVFVYKLVVENTVEEKILLLQQRKQALAEDIYEKPGEGKELSSLTAEDILDLFG